MAITYLSLVPLLLLFCSVVDTTMAEQQIAFCAALQHFGFPQPAMNSLIANGLTSTQDLIGIDAKDIDR
jgi:hypothetical protein